MTPLVSVIIPLLADRPAASRLLAQIPIDLRVEVIVAEAHGLAGSPGAADTRGRAAGDEPGLEELGRGRPDIKLIRTRTGRAGQMNAAAGLARGEWLLFLHADSTLAPDWLDAWAGALTESTVGGWFRFALDDRAWQARVIESGVALRVKLFTLPYGDQGLFVRRRTFVQMGGYRDVPLMEDVELMRRLVDLGEVVEVPRAIVTSARRWRRDGWFRRSARNVLLLTLYFLGVSPTRLARWY
jgi:rSAM/selenodomain-associated transferase 2